MLGFYNYTTWLTYLGALCGVAGIVCVCAGQMTAAVILLSIAGFIDGFDGKVASTKKDRTDEMRRFGIQIDSLSDLICFGVLPGVMLIGFARAAFPDIGNAVYAFTPLSCLFALAALIRLAYFNVSEETRQKEEGGVRKYYTGIPVTLVSIFSPLFFGLSELLRFLFRNSVPASAWNKGFFFFYCALLAFFAFGFLCKKLKVAKLHGKKMLLLVLLGCIAAAGVVISAVLNS